MLQIQVDIVGNEFYSFLRKSEKLSFRDDICTESHNGAGFFLTLLLSLCCEVMNASTLFLPYFIHSKILMRNERCKRRFAGCYGCYRGESVKASVLTSQGERENGETRKHVMGNVWEENAKDGDATCLGSSQGNSSWGQ